MIETFFEALTVIFFFIGLCLYLHFLAYAISWGWAKGQAKVTKKIYNYHKQGEPWWAEQPTNTTSE